MTHLRTIASILGAVTLVATGCSAGTEDSTSTAPTTTAAATTTQAPTTTTMAPLRSVTVTGDIEPALATALGSVLSWRVDQRNPDPPMPQEMAVPVLEMELDLPETVEVASSRAALEGGTVAIVRTAAGDIYAAADEGLGWQIVGAAAAAGGGWFGAEPRMVVVLGSDARPGQLQQRFRADSIHVVTARASDRNGAIVGFPRDSWVDSEFGTMKLSSVMASRGPEIMAQAMRDLFELPIEGYVVTGFKGFEELMWDLGGLPIDLPRGIPTQEFWAGFRSGEQTLSPPRVLQYARTRKGVPGGDLGRSLNQGTVMLAMLRLMQTNEIFAAPGFLKILERHTWTDLPPSSLIQLAAAAFLLDADAIQNAVVPGTQGRAGGGSVVFLDDEAGPMLADLVDDGLLEGSED